MKNNRVDNARVDTDFRQKGNSPGPDSFLLKSDRGYVVKLIFTWDGRNIKNVQITPEENPYEPAELKF